MLDFAGSACLGACLLAVVLVLLKVFNRRVRFLMAPYPLFSRSLMFFSLAFGVTLSAFVLHFLFFQPPKPPSCFSASTWPGFLLQYLTPCLSIDPGEDRRWSSWYLSPEQHIAEWIVINAVGIPAVLWGLYVRPWSFRVVQAEKRSRKSRAQLFFAVSLYVLFFWLLTYKVYTQYVYAPSLKEKEPVEGKALIYLLQPCHVLTLFAAVVLSLPSSLDSLAGRLFSFYLHSLWGVWLGIIFADTEDYYYRNVPLEIVHFYFQHVHAGIILPLWLVMCKPYSLAHFDPWTNGCIHVLYHFDILFPASFLGKVVVNYMSHPLVNTPLMLFGKGYRLAMCLGTFFLNWLSGSVFTDALIYLERRCSKSGIIQIESNDVKGH